MMLTRPSIFCTRLVFYHSFSLSLSLACTVKLFSFLSLPIPLSKFFSLSLSFSLIFSRSLLLCRYCSSRTLNHFLHRCHHAHSKEIKSQAHNPHIHHILFTLGKCFSLLRFPIIGIKYTMKSYDNASVDAQLFSSFFAIY